MVGKNGATLLCKNNENINNALIHNCIGIILSTGIVGNKKLVNEKNPLIAKNKAKTTIYLFIIQLQYIIFLVF